MIGLGAGIASNDTQDIFKYAGLGLSTGGLAGSSVANLGINGLQRVSKGTSNIKSDFQRAYYGQEYDERMNKKADQKWMKDIDTQNHYRSLYGDDWKNMMQQDLTLRQYGLDDQGDIDKARDLVLKNGATNEEAAAIVNLSKDVSKDAMINNRDKVEDQIAKMTGDAKNTQRAMDFLDSYYGLAAVSSSPSNQGQSQGSRTNSSSTPQSQGRNSNSSTTTGQAQSSTTNLPPTPRQAQTSRPNLPPTPEQTQESRARLSRAERNKEQTKLSRAERNKEQAKQRKKEEEMQKRVEEIKKRNERIHGYRNNINDEGKK